MTGVYVKAFTAVLVLSSVLFALDVFALPAVTDDLKKESGEFFQNECKGCHRWARKFAAPPMKENVLQYRGRPDEMVQYLMHPTPKHPELWPAMEITPLTETQAKKMTAWLLFLRDNEDDPTRPK